MDDIAGKCKYSDDCNYVCGYLTPKQIAECSSYGVFSKLDKKRERMASAHLEEFNVLSEDREYTVTDVNSEVNLSLKKLVENTELILSESYSNACNASRLSDTLDKVRDRLVQLDNAISMVVRPSIFIQRDSDILDVLSSIEVRIYSEISKIKEAIHSPMKTKKRWFNFKWPWKNK